MIGWFFHVKEADRKIWRQSLLGYDREKKETGQNFWKALNFRSLSSLFMNMPAAAEEKYGLERVSSNNGLFELVLRRFAAG